MDISPKFEAKLEKASYASLLSEFEGKILPAHHPITRHVHRVVSDLLEGSDLGTLRSSNPRNSPADDDGFWHDDPFVAARPDDLHTSPDKGAKEWDLLVVNDPTTVNALASFGMQCRGALSHSLKSPFFRYHSRFHWDSARLQG